MRMLWSGVAVVLLAGFVGCGPSALERAEEEAHVAEIRQQRKQQKLEFATKFHAVSDWRAAIEEKYETSFSGAPAYLVEEALCIGQPVIVELEILDLERVEGGAAIVYGRTPTLLSFGSYSDRHLCYQLFAKQSLVDRLILAATSYSLTFSSFGGGQTVAARILEVGTEVGRDGVVIQTAKGELLGVMD